MSKLNKIEEYVIAPGETILELLEVNCMTQLVISTQITGHRPFVIDIQFVISEIPQFFNPVFQCYIKERHVVFLYTLSFFVSLF